MESNERKVKARITSSVSLSRLNEISKQVLNERSKEDWKKVCDHVKKIADDYWRRDALLEDEMERTVINICVESSDESDIDIDDYWRRDALLEDEMERTVINICVESSDESDIDIDSLKGDYHFVEVKNDVKQDLVEFKTEPETVDEVTPPSNQNQDKEENEGSQPACKCRYSCRTISASWMETLFLNYYHLCVAEKGTYLMGLMELIPVKRRRHGKYKQPEESRRQATVIYSVPDGNGSTVQVCKSMFCHIFDLSKRKLQVLHSKKKQGHTTYIDFRRNRAARTKNLNENDSLLGLQLYKLPSNISKDL
ncbi:hypothetical protein C0J52_17485 [Blattella germanica]|nr:hypothetical protein C0J52_17485 [Blattella germanica]